MFGFLFGIVNFILFIPSGELAQRFIQHYPSSLGDDRYPELSSGLFEGDIIMGISDDAKNAVVAKELKWPGGVIVYDFTSNYTETEKEKVIKSMGLLESKTCVKFQQRKGDETHILINKRAGYGCFALIGYRPDYSPIPVNLQSPECLYYDGTIQHELLHVIGLLHEQSRSDRDDFVNILWDNIENAHYSDFSKALPGSTTTYGIPYNTMSVMHYPNIAFSKNGKPTIVSKKNPELEMMGQREGVTEGDLEKVRRMYNCKTDSNNSHLSNFLNIFKIFKA